MSYNKTVVVSAHGDTNWKSHSLSVFASGGLDSPNDQELEYFGHMDNFAGVHAVMNAYFSGKLPTKGVRIEITYAEETTMEGARDVARTLTKSDVVLVVDVTGTPTSKDIVIEKCYNKRLRHATTSALTRANISFDIYAGCPDPVCSQDESDVYRKVTDYVMFVGIPVRGGDYNDGPVKCWKRSIDGLSNALVTLCTALQVFETEPPDTRTVEDDALATQMDFLSLTGF